MPTNDADPDSISDDPARSIEAEILADAEQTLREMLSRYEPEDRAVVSAVIETLDGRGPMPMGDLVTDLRDRGLLDHLHDPDDPDGPNDPDGLDDLQLAMEIDDMLIGTDEVTGEPTALEHLIAHTRTLSEGLVFTHRLTAREQQTGLLDAHPDLMYLDQPFRRLALGDGELTMVFDFDADTLFGHDADHHESDISPEGSIRGPAGWLDPFAAGDLVAIMRRGATAEVFRVDETGLDDAERQRAALRLAADELVGEGRSAEPSEFLRAASVADPDAFRRPGPPLRELFDEIGLEGRDCYYGRAGEEFTTLGENIQIRGAVMRSMKFGFGPCCEEQYDIARRAWARFRLQQIELEHHQLVEAADALAHSEVTSAVIDAALGDWEERSEVLDRFADELIALGGTRCAPGLLIRASGEELDGDVLAAEASLEAAVRADGALAPALRVLAMFAADRGGPARALRLLHRAEIDGGREVELLTELTAVPAGVGRNEPCPCGSGRKFKQCCQRTPRPAPGARARWLTNRLVTFLGRPQRIGVFIELVSIATAAAGAGVDRRDLQEQFSSDPILMSLAIFQTGAIADYADERGPLLDDVDRQLVDSWRRVGFALYEISAVKPGVSITMRDTTTADIVTIDEADLSHDAEIGEYLLGVVGDIDGGRQELLGGAMLLSLQERDALLPLFDDGASAMQLAAWYGSRFAPPVLLNTEGDPTVMCEAVIGYGLEAQEIDRRLTAHFGEPIDEGAEDGADDSVVWHAHLPDEEGSLPGQTIRWTVRRVGDRVHVDANSERRFDEAVGDLHDLLGEPTSYEEDRAPFTFPGPDTDQDDPAGLLTDQVGGGPIDLSDPEAAEMMQDISRQLEDRWLADQIPALGGLTPHEAAADPSRRGDLIELLNEFERLDAGAPPGAMTYDVDRLRAELGLT